MPRRRAAVAVMALVGGLALAGCSGDDGGSGPAPAIPTPTAVGDRPVVEVLDAGGADPRVLTLALTPDSTSEATVDISQEVTRDEQVTQVPPISIPFTSVVGAAGEGGGVTVEATYGEPTVDATGLTSGEVAGVKEALTTLTGTESTLVVRPDGTTVEATSGVPAAAAVDGQVRALVPVLPSQAVGIGARWKATSVVEVDGAVVDQVASYTLKSLDGDDYDLDVTLDQTYRPGRVQDVEVRSGRGTVTAQLTGNLGRLLPTKASGNVATQVTYVVGGQATDVRTTVTLGLTAT